MTEQYPQNQDCEKALIGSVLIDPGAYDLATQFISAGDFYLLRHQLVWKAFSALRVSGAPIDFLTVSTELERCGNLQEVGGSGYLVGLLNACPTSTNWEAYAREIKQTEIKRQMIDLASHLAADSYSGTMPLDQAITRARSGLDKLASISTGHDVTLLAPILSTVYDEIAERVKNPCEIWGVPIGLPKLDKETGGQQRGELTLLAGEPGLGKTWLAIGAAMELVKSAPGIFFSLEMRKEAIVRRMVSAISGIRSRVLKSGFLQEDDFSNLIYAVEKLDGMPIYLDDRARDTGGLRSTLAKLKHEINIQWFIVDYLLLLEDKGTNEIEKTSNISLALKHICRDLDLAGIVVHSVTKAGMDKTGIESHAKSNLRGSGQIIYDADLVLYLTEFEDSEKTFYTDDQKKRMSTLWVKKGRELEDPKIRIHLVRKQDSPLWGQLD